MCIICCDEQKRIPLELCQCDVCCGCYLLYIKTELENTPQIDVLYCAGQCGVAYTLEDVLMVEELRDDLNKVLLLKHLQTSSSIRACPNQNCGNFGILPPKLCDQKLSCLSCGSQWDCPEIMTTKKKIWMSIVNYHQTINETLNSVHNMFMNKSCPECSIPIYKNGGCFHMTCRQCNYEFCWYCRQEFNTHNTNICRLHFLLKYGLMSNLMLNILVITDLHTFLYTKLIAFITFVLWLLISNVFAVYLLSTVQETKDYIQVIKYAREFYPEGNLSLMLARQQLYRQISGNISLMGILLIITVLFRLNPSFLGWVWFLVQEAVIASALVYIYGWQKSYSQFLVQGWLQYVR